MKKHIILLLLIVLGLGAAMIFMRNKYEADAAANCQKGSEFFDSRQYDKAIAECTSALKLAPDMQEAFYIRGKSYFLLNEYDLAIADFSTVVKNSPNHHYCHYMLGYSYDGANKYDQALQSLTTAIKLAPDKSEYYRKRGEVYNHLKQYDKALEDFSHAIHSPPMADDVFAYSGRAMAYYEIKQYAKAIDDFTQVIKLEPENSYAFYWRGKSYCMLKQYDKMLQDLAKLIELAPQDQYSYINGIELLLISGNADEAAKWRKKLDAAIPADKLSVKDRIVMQFLSIFGKAMKNEDIVADTEQLKLQLKDKVDLDWNFDLTDAWLNDAQNGLTQPQINQLRTLTNTVKTAIH